MANCEKNVLEIPVSPSAPAGTDYVMFTLADGTTVLRTWANVAAGPTSLPDDFEGETLASGSNTNNFIEGNNTIILPNFIGKKIRVNRGSVPQSTLLGQISWNIATGTLTVNPAPTGPGEFWQVQAYK